MTKRSLNKRLDSLEPARSGQTFSPAALAILASVYGKLHALFLPYRSHLDSWPGIGRLRRGYIGGTIGISASVSGQKNWVAGHDARLELESAGLAVCIRGAVETTGLILTPKGRAVAWSLCRELIPGIQHSGIMVQHLAEGLEPCRIRGTERWVSEAKLFGLPCVGSTSDWQHMTDLLLEPAISGAVQSTADVAGHVFYKFVRPFEDLPSIDNVEPNDMAVDAYLSSYKSELARLRNLDSVDGEIVVPLSVT
ncbi:MAG: hypothetical protein WKF77_06215 [Planctomycetaceae bacterium]